MIAILVTTYNRPVALSRSLPQISRFGYPVLVVDDCSSNCQENEDICRNEKAHYLRLPSNRGLAAAMNVGLSYYFADKTIQWISYFQDDVDVHPSTLKTMRDIAPMAHIMTGHDAAEHPSFSQRQFKTGVQIKSKWSCRATHLHASVEFWKSVFPMPTNEIGTPKRNGTGRGLGSNVDWWIVRDAPKSCWKSKRPILCVPGLVRTFCWTAEESTWNNMLKTGEEPPLVEQWTS